MSENVNRREFMSAVTGATLGAHPLSGSRAAPPNIVFILTDDQRWDSMGAAGHPFLRTPQMDRIAREGALFTNAFVTTPVCSPSRASFLTGRYPHSHGVTGNADHGALSHRLITFPRLLHERGYDTAYIGKWHMGRDDSPRPGFDHWVSFRGQGVYVDPTLNLDGETRKVNGYVTDIFTDYAVEFINRRRPRPFLMCLGHKAPHSPFIPTERHDNLYADRPVNRRPNAQDSLDGKPVLQRPIQNYARVGPGRGPGDELIRNQLRTLVAVDDSVGRVLGALEAIGQLDQTVVVYTSDHGYFWGEHGLGDKRAAYEEAIRIPLVMRYPKLIPAGTRIDRFALNIDIAPTLLELAGAPVAAYVQGRSLAPLLKGESVNWRTSFLLEYYVDPTQQRIPSWQAVRTGRWKYIRYTEMDGVDELYDLAADPFEMTNLIRDPAASDELNYLKAEMDRLLKETKYRGRRVRVSGVLIDQWCATTTRSLADARKHTRVCALMDGCVGSGFAIFTDTKLVRIPNEHKNLVIEFLENSPKQSDLRVTAEFLEDGDRFALVRLTHEE